MRATLLALALVLGTASAADIDYKRDIDFLLGEFETKAGHFFEQKEIDWPEVSNWARTEVKQIQTDADHLRLCTRLVARLKDGHARIKGAKVEWPSESQGRKWRHPKIGMLYSGGKALVASADPTLGIPLGSEVLEIDDLPVVKWLEMKADEWSDKRGYSTRHHALHNAAVFGLGGWEGTTFKIKAALPGGKEITKTVIRDLEGETPRRTDFRTQLGKIEWLDDRRKVGFTKTSSGNGYIRLLKIPGDLPELLDQILVSLKNVPGMVLDMRGNTGGGCDHRAVFSRFIEKGKFWGPVESTGENPFAGPLVVIVDGGTLSAGETVSGQFSEDQRAYMIGTSPTAGMSSSKTTITAPSGLFSAYFSVRSNKQRFNQGRGIEGIGVQPHEIITVRAEDLAAGKDTLVARAEELLSTGYWPEVIDYDGRTNSK
ncbi:S41 family peptidase [Verrucomicrobiales bacterium]|nr:S41 family peptidase [Verrucomicrobiales bacterium]